MTAGQPLLQAVAPVGCCSRSASTPARRSSPPPSPPRTSTLPATRAA